jgi:isocitrate dehydrogenase kinase/phosphatase
VAANDIFPEEFATFLLPDPDVRATFSEKHADLLDATWWQAAQKTLADGDLPEVLSYPDATRFAPASGAKAKRHTTADQTPRPDVHHAPR